MLHGPEEMSIACLSDSAKEKITEILTRKFHNSKHWSDVENVINMMRNGQAGNQEEMFKRLSKTDQYRNQHLKETHPELAEIIGYE